MPGKWNDQKRSVSKNDEYWLLSIVIYQPSKPLPGSKNSHFQNEAKCATSFVKLSFICMRMKNRFHVKEWALHLVLIQRPGGTRKWPVDLYWALQRYTCDSNKTFWLAMEIIMNFTRFRYFIAGSSGLELLLCFNSKSNPLSILWFSCIYFNSFPVQRTWRVGVLTECWAVSINSNPIIPLKWTMLQTLPL